MKLKKVILNTIIFSGLSLSGFAQDDLLGDLDKIAPTKAQVASATFKSARIVSGNSIETFPAKHLEFLIDHRFGALNGTSQNFMGLDESKIRLALGYGITDKLSIGIGRSSNGKEVDYYVKYKLLQQKTGPGFHPVTISALISGYSNTTNIVTVLGTPTPATVSMGSSNDGSFYFYNIKDRLAFLSQLLIAKKFGEKISLELNPTILHQNLVPSVTDANGNSLAMPNNIYSLGMGGRYKITKRTTFNVEYYYNATNVFNANSMSTQFKNPLSLSFDIDTGGHVFQFMVTNSRGMTEKQLIGNTMDTWAKGGLFYGFNISRMFSFDKKKKI